jgi:putative two-component system response regulator
MAGRPKILVVDDSPHNIDILMEFLAPQYNVVAASDGAQALALAKIEPVPDLILLDVVMPGVDGYQVCGALKADSRTHDIPVLFLTALSEDEEETRGLALGAVDYIKKPFNFAVVRNRIENHLKWKFHQDALEEMVGQRTASLRLTQDAAIYGLGILAEFRDPDTGEHIQRTKNYMRILCDSLRTHPRFRDYLTPAVIDLLYKSTPLHDIGKVAIPDDILLKPAPLTDREFEIMMTHTTVGRDIIRRIRARVSDEQVTSFLLLSEELTYFHHEHWDGTGYHGYAGDDIPVPGRLMALADVYDALVSPRVYKPALDHATVVKVMTEGDGRTRPEHFDPDILQVFLDRHSEFEELTRLHPSL